MRYGSSLVLSVSITEEGISPALSLPETGLAEALPVLTLGIMRGVGGNSNGQAPQQWASSMLAAHWLELSHVAPQPKTGGGDGVPTGQPSPRGTSMNERERTHL